MKRYLSASLVLILMTFGLPAKSYALELCFSNLADSVWQSGEPLEVKNLLNYELVGSYTKTYQENQKFGVQEWLDSDNGQLTNKIVYEYQGKNCAKRTVLIKNTIIIPTPNFINKDQLIEILKSKSKDFIEEQRRIKSLDNAISFLKENTTYVSGASFNPKTGSYDVRNFLFRGYAQPVYELVAESNAGFYPTIIEQLQSLECSFFINRDDRTSRKTHTRNNLVSLRYGKAQTCALNWYWHDGANSLFSLGATTLVREATITCIKGKTTKKVSGTNPKCPKGYKKAS